MTTEPMRPAWDKLMTILESYGVEKPRDRFVEGGGDICYFFDRWHGPYGSRQKIGEAIINVVIEEVRIRMNDVT